jgi:hypothetical protein
VATKRHRPVSQPPGYDDGRVICTGDAIILRRYYTWRSRAIKYRDIREARQFRLSASGKWRLQGSGDWVHWFNYDPARRHKDRALVLSVLAADRATTFPRTPGDFDEPKKPVITPDDPDRFIAELAAHGITVTNGQGDEGGYFLPMDAAPGTP